MNNFRIILALIAFSCVAWGAPIDPSPYDPQPPHQPGRPGVGRPQRPPRPQPPLPPHPPRPGYGDRREIYVGQQMWDQSLDLMRLLNLWSSSGSSIQSVEIWLRPQNTYGNLQLMADGFVEDAQGAYSSVVVLNPRRQLVIGSNVRNLFLNVQGRAYVDRIVVFLGSGSGAYPYPGPGPAPIADEVVLPLYFGNIFQAPSLLEILNASGASQYAGYRLQSITIYGQAMAYRAGVQILANGNLMGKVELANFASAQIFYPNYQLIVGNHLYSLDVITDGSLRLDRVEIRLTRY